MVVIFRGPSGSGKSRLAALMASTEFAWPADPSANIEKTKPISTPATEYVRQLWNSYIKKEHKFYKCSADDFFMVEGLYKFDAKMLGAAQAACLRHFYEAVNDTKAIIVVDNTNTSLTEVVPYAALANAFSHDLQVITLMVPPETAWARNQHRVPFGKVVQQSLRLQDSIANWPSWYPQHIFPE